MQFLEADETSFLHTLLVNHIFIANEAARSDLLVNCGLQALLPVLSSLGKSPLLFVHELTARLSQVSATSLTVEQPGLVALLNYLTLPPYDNGLTPDEKRVLAQIEQKCWQWHTSQRRQSSLAISYPPDPSTSFSTTSTPAQISIGREQLIVNYGLYSSVATFINRANYGKVAGFTINGDFNIIRDYLTPRLCNEMKRKISGKQLLLDVTLTADDLGESADSIKQKFTRRYGCQQLTDLLQLDENAHLVLIVWCYTIPPDGIKSIIIPFWREIEETVLPLLKLRGRCMILSLANIAGESIPYQLDDFTPLTMPSEYDLDDLLPWFQERLRELNIAQYDITFCLRRLADHGGHFVRTYRELESIVVFLQKKYDFIR